jgi:hypothetical protein
MHTGKLKISKMDKRLIEGSVFSFDPENLVFVLLRRTGITFYYSTGLIVPIEDISILEIYGDGSLVNKEGLSKIIQKRYVDLKKVYNDIVHRWNLYIESTKSISPK